MSIKMYIFIYTNVMYGMQKVIHAYIKRATLYYLQKVGEAEKTTKSFLMAVLLKPGWGKGRGLKEKITFFYLFSDCH